MTDGQDRVGRVNEACARLLERRPSELLGRTLRELILSDDALALQGLLQSARRVPGSVPSAELTFLTDELPLPLRLTALAKAGPDGSGSMLLVLENRSEISTLQERVAYLTGIDPMTGLANLLQLGRQLQQELKTRPRLTLVLLALSRFQEINDVFGYDGGDRLLAEIAGRISTCIPPSAFLARANGARFVILLEEEATAGRAVVDQIFRSLKTPFLLGGQSLRVCARAGICRYPDDGKAPEELLRQAETALFQTRDRTGNISQSYSPELKQRARIRLELDSNLAKALERNQFELYYQPLIDPSQGKVTGAEALLRWNHPERGLVLPLEFLPQLEAAGLSDVVGGWILHQACQQARSWQTKGIAPLRTSVNIMAESFRGEGFVTALEETLGRSGLGADGLEVEVTERILMQDAATSQRVLGELKELGVGVAIDDFGTGYSSLAQLKRFQVQTLKIDRSFVSGIPHDRDGVAITTTILSMARSLGLQVIAEGVETHDQLAFLHELSCPRVQGYLFARPMPAGEFSTWLETGAGHLKTYPPRPTSC